MQRLVDADFPLKTIGDFVGHRSAGSTEIYAQGRRRAAASGRPRRRRGGAVDDRRASSCRRRSASSRTSGRSAASTTARRPSCGCCVRFADRARRRPSSTSSPPALLDDFLASRPRSRPRSFNHLLGVVRGLLDWAVTQRAAAGLAAAGPPTPRDRRRASRSCSTSPQARRLLDAAAGAAGQPAGPRPRARPTTRSSPSATGSGCAPARPAGCASATSIPTAICWSCGAASSARAGSSRTGRASASCSPSRSQRRARRRRAGDDAPLFSFDGRRCVHPGTASQVFHQLVADARSPGPRRGLAADGCTICATPSRSGCLLRWYREGLDPSAAAAPAVDVHGPRRPGLHRGLPDDHPGAAGRGEPALRSLRRTGLAGGRRDDRSPSRSGRSLQSFFVDHLITVKGLRPASVRSYRDTIRLLLVFAAADKRLQDHPAQRRRPDLRPGRRVPAPPRRRPRQPRPHPQPAARRAAHPVRLHRHAATRRCSASASRSRPSR